MSSAMTKNNDLDNDARYSAGRQQLFLKGAILLLCAGIFALILWSGANHPDPCLANDAASQEACLAQSRAQALRPPAKGAFAPVSSGSPYRSSN
jgi:hypothetical protein